MGFNSGFKALKYYKPILKHLKFTRTCFGLLWNYPPGVRYKECR